MSKKIEELTIDETKEAISKNQLFKKALKIRITAHKNGRLLKTLDKKRIKEEKSRTLKRIQDEIKSAKTTALKEQKRSDKLTKAKSFDNRIKNIDNAIDKINTDISNVNNQIAKINYDLEALKQHLQSLK